MAKLKKATVKKATVKKAKTEPVDNAEVVEELIAHINRTPLKKRQFLTEEFVAMRLGFDSDTDFDSWWRSVEGRDVRKKSSVKGANYNRYINEHIANEAKKLLREGQAPETVVTDCGYKDKAEMDLHLRGRTGFSIEGIVRDVTVKQNNSSGAKEDKDQPEEFVTKEILPDIQAVLDEMEIRGKRGDAKFTTGEMIRVAATIRKLHPPEHDFRQRFKKATATMPGDRWEDVKSKYAASNPLMVKLDKQIDDVDFNNEDILNVSLREQ